MLREVSFNDLYTTIIVASLTIIVSAKLINFKSFLDFIRLFGASNYLKVYFKDHLFLDPFDILLFLNFCVNGTLTGVLTYSHFAQKFEPVQTKFKILYDQKYLYIALKALDP